jgi:dephospho-CoA kinase
MLRVGLTGGIGAGKSTVAGRLAEHGAVVLDADRIAREVVEPGTDGLAEVVATFGADVLAQDGSLDRAALAARAFADDAARQRLNAILHPRIGARTAELMAAAPEDAVVVHDIPLLVESGLAPAYHLVLVVHADIDQRVRRLAVSRGMTEQDARGRVAAQATDEQRRAAADVWLDNTADPERLLAEVDALWTDRLVPYEANVRLGRGAGRSAPVLVEPDPTWPAQAERLVARVRVAAGETALRVDHVGSTSVPGLAAKDVIDLQLTVDSLADAEAIAGALGAAGFPHLPGFDFDDPKPGYPDPEQWRKRVHTNADPGRRVNLHLRVAGSPGWRQTLLFRDWLRAEPVVRSEYDQLKRRLVKEEVDIEGYVAGKRPWFDTALPRAEEWARRTGWAP